jgi:hypothetical protein
LASFLRGGAFCFTRFGAGIAVSFVASFGDWACGEFFWWWRRWF